MQILPAEGRSRMKRRDAKSAKGGQKQRPEPLPVFEPSSSSVISKRGWFFIGTGVFIGFLGYCLLTLTDPLGQNWASKISPFVIIGGYVLIGAGIVTPPASQP